MCICSVIIVQMFQPNVNMVVRFITFACIYAVKKLYYRIDVDKSFNLLGNIKSNPLSFPKKKFSVIVHCFFGINTFHLRNPSRSSWKTAICSFFSKVMNWSLSVRIENHGVFVNDSLCGLPSSPKSSSNFSQCILKQYPLFQYPRRSKIALGLIGLRLHLPTKSLSNTYKRLNHFPLLLHHSSRIIC